MDRHSWSQIAMATCIPLHESNRGGGSRSGMRRQQGSERYAGRRLSSESHPPPLLLLLFILFHPLLPFFHLLFFQFGSQIKLFRTTNQAKLSHGKWNKGINTSVFPSLKLSNPQPHLCPPPLLLLLLPMWHTIPPQRKRLPVCLPAGI